jgi:hypothetical protein
MGQFADECEIMYLAVKLLHEQYALPRPPVVLFLKMDLPDWRESFDPPDKLLRLLAGLPIAVRPRSRAEEIFPRVWAGLPPTHRDPRTGEVGYRASVGVRKWYPDGTADVSAAVHFAAALVDRAVRAVAVRIEDSWTLDGVGLMIS